MSKTINNIFPSGGGAVKGAHAPGWGMGLEGREVPGTTVTPRQGPPSAPQGTGTPSGGQSLLGALGTELMPGNFKDVVTLLAPHPEGSWGNSASGVHG